MVTKRTDIHRPSVINPGDYAFTGTVYDLKYDDLETLEAGTKPYGHCNHCGKAIRWAVEFTHLPTQDTVVFGTDCSDVLSLSDSRSQHELTLLKRRVANLEKADRRNKEAAANRALFQIHNADVVEFLDTLGEKDDAPYFLKSLKHNLDQYGMLTTNQVIAFRNCKQQYEARIVAKANEPKPTSPVVEGRQELQGEILGYKFHYGDYGTQVKMRVRLADHNVVYGTCPASIESQVQDLNQLRGKKVVFTATVTRSDKDENFGFFSRPSKGSITG